MSVYDSDESSLFVGNDEPSIPDLHSLDSLTQEARDKVAFLRIDIRAKGQADPEWKHQMSRDLLISNQKTLNRLLLKAKKNRDVKEEQRRSRMRRGSDEGQHRPLVYNEDVIANNDDVWNEGANRFRVTIRHAELGIFHALYVMKQKRSRASPVNKFDVREYIKAMDMMEECEKEIENLKREAAVPVPPQAPQNTKAEHRRGRMIRITEDIKKTEAIIQLVKRELSIQRTEDQKENPAPFWLVNVDEAEKRLQEAKETKADYEEMLAVLEEEERVEQRRPKKRPRAVSPPRVFPNVPRGGPRRKPLKKGSAAWDARHQADLAEKALERALKALGDFEREHGTKDDLMQMRPKDLRLIEKRKKKEEDWKTAQWRVREARKRLERSEGRMQAERDMPEEERIYRHKIDRCVAIKAQAVSRMREMRVKGQDNTTAGRDDFRRVNIIAERAEGYRKVFQSQKFNYLIEVGNYPGLGYDDREQVPEFPEWTPIYHAETRAHWVKFIKGLETLHDYMLQTSRLIDVPEVAEPNARGQPVIKKPKIMTYGIRFIFLLKLEGVTAKTKERVIQQRKNEALHKVRGILNEVSAGNDYVHCAHDGCVCIHFYETLRSVCLNLSIDMKLMVDIAGVKLHIFNVWKQLDNVNNPVLRAAPGSTLGYPDAARALRIPNVAQGARELERLCTDALQHVKLPPTLEHYPRGDPKSLALYYHQYINDLSNPEDVPHTTYKNRFNIRGMKERDELWMVKDDEDEEEALERRTTYRAPYGWMTVRVSSKFYRSVLDRDMLVTNMQIFERALNNLAEKLKDVSHDNCYTHVHIGRQEKGFEVQTLRQVAAFAYTFEPELDLLVPPNRLGGNSDARSMRDFSGLSQEPSVMSGLRRIYNSDKRALINILEELHFSGHHPSTMALDVSEPVLAFRHFEGTFVGPDVARWIWILLYVAEFLSETSPAVVQRELEAKLAAIGEGLEGKPWDRLSEGEVRRKLGVLCGMLGKMGDMTFLRKWVEDRFKRSHPEREVLL